MSIDFPFDITMGWIDKSLERFGWHSQREGHGDLSCNYSREWKLTRAWWHIHKHMQTHTHRGGSCNILFPYILFNFNLLHTSSNRVFHPLSHDCMCDDGGSSLNIDACFVPALPHLSSCHFWDERIVMLWGCLGIHSIRNILHMSLSVLDVLVLFATRCLWRNLCRKEFGLVRSNCGPHFGVIHEYFHGESNKDCLIIPVYLQYQCNMVVMIITNHLDAK